MWRQVADRQHKTINSVRATVGGSDHNTAFVRLGADDVGDAQFEPVGVVSPQPVNHARKISTVNQTRNKRAPLFLMLIGEPIHEMGRLIRERTHVGRANIEQMVGAGGTIGYTTRDPCSITFEHNHARL